MKIEQFNASNFQSICDILASKHLYFKKVIDDYGYPPFWNRKPTFETLIHIILEQQVSLASARAAFVRLKSKIGIITPNKILSLNDAELKACYFSRQKIVYVRHLAASLQNKSIQLKKLNMLPDEDIRVQLKKVKGIGNWTVDVYLMMCLNRLDLFPINDIALIKGIHEIMNYKTKLSDSKVIQITLQWSPYRTIAAYLCWHAYLSKRKFV